MLLLLPPSETKRDGGADASALDLAALSFPELTPQRKTAIAALRRLSRSVSDSAAALGLGATQRFEIDRNRALTASPVLPALERYTGVLFDALDAGTLTDDARAFAGDRVAIGSALFGLLLAEDPIPAYRCSHDSRLPGLSLRAHWRAAVSARVVAHPGLVLDLRSGPYSALGPAHNGTLLRVVADHPDGRRLAISHANKLAKGRFVRAMLQAGADHSSTGSLLEWAAHSGFRLEEGPGSSLDLIAESA